MNKKMTLFGLISFLVSGIIVLDTFVAPAALGASSITLWLIVVVLFMIPNGFINAELGGAYPDGLVLWIKKSMGDFHATIAGWFYWVNVAFWMPAVFIVFTYWFSMTFFPDGEGWTVLGQGQMIAIAIAATWILVAIVRRGIDTSIFMSKIATIIKVSVLLLFGTLGIVHAFQNGFSEVFVGANWIPQLSDFGSLSLVTAIVFNLLGFELVAAIGDDVKDPEKTIPKAIIIGAAIIGFLYIFATFGVLQAATPADLANDAFILDGFIISMEVLTADVFGSAGPIIFKVIMAGALFSLVMNMISWVIGANEILEDVPFAKNFKVFNVRHPKYNTLSKSFVLMGVISSVLILVGMGLGESGDEAFWTILAFSMVIFIFPYIYLTPAILKLRKQDGDDARHFMVPGGKLGLNIAAILNFIFIALALVLLLVSNQGYALYYPVVIIGTIITTGIGVWFYKVGQRST